MKVLFYTSIERLGVGWGREVRFEVCDRPTDEAGFTVAPGGGDQTRSALSCTGGIVFLSSGMMVAVRFFRPGIEVVYDFETWRFDVFGLRRQI